jgi:tRNA threonylcarbamoyladenosine biosynthesis protein TsaB
MRVLGIETSWNTCGFAVVEDERLLGEALSGAAGRHVEESTAMISALLDEIPVALRDLDGVAVSLGPGSFTGLRIGLGTAKGICFGTGLPLAGVPTLDCMAESLCPWDGYIVPVRDARRGEIYMASYRSRGGLVERLSDYRALTPGAAVEEVAALAADDRTVVAGDALVRYGEFLRDRLSSGVVFGEEGRGMPHPATVARIGVRMFREGRTLDLGRSEPLYVRPSEAERAAGGLSRDAASSH